jgi:hypothetical protein
MNPNLKRKLIATLFAPVLGLAVGVAYGQTGGGGMSGGGTTGSSATGSGTTGAPSSGYGASSGGTSSTSAGDRANTGASGSTMGATSRGGPNNTNSKTWDTGTFDRLDVNRDGRISRTEAASDDLMMNHWSRMDSTNQGYVDRENFERFRANLGNRANDNTNSKTGNPAASGSSTSGSPSK